MFILAADCSGMQGDWAHTLGLPFSGFAQESFWLVPVAVLLPCVLPRRIPKWLTNAVCSVLALGLVFFPIAIFSFGARSITFHGKTPAGLSKALSAELGFPVLIVYSGTSLVYFPRVHDTSLVRDAFYRHLARLDAKALSNPAH